MPFGKTKTALITGASSGIGAAFARELAARGYDLILVARRQERLEKLTRELNERYGIEAAVLVADLATEQGMTSVEERIRLTEPLTILINNAGFGVPGLFHEHELEKTINMLNVHVIASTRFTWTALQQMATRNQGVIINVSSIAAFLPYPMAVGYCSTKAYLNVFSEALQNQLRHTNITIQALCPGFTYSEFHDTPEVRDSFHRSDYPKWMWMNAGEVVEHSLNALSKKNVIVIPGWRNRMLVWLMKNGVTAWLARAIMARKV